MNESNEMPLVTFALFAYNQETFIREAIEGAFAQDYSPLEIILSDDCSTDRTFEIMQEMSMAYVGQHKILVVRNPENLGVLRHVQSVAARANGEFFVIAAGDDISKNHRTRTLVSAWQSEVSSVYSAYELIGPDGELISKNQIPIAEAALRLPWLKKICFPEYVYGATSAYKTKLIRFLPPTNARVMSEDSILNTLIQVFGFRPKIVEESLVLYRAHYNTISNSISVGRTIPELKIAENRNAIQFGMQLEMLRYILVEFQNFICNIDNIHKNTIDNKLLNNQIKYLETQLHWNRTTVLERIKHIARNSDKKQRKWMLARVFGLNVYCRVKSLSYIFKPVYIPSWRK